MHKKLLCLVIYILPFFTVLSQDKEATLYFRDGTSILGYGELKMEKKVLRSPKKGVILFKVSKADEADEWTGEDVDRIVFLEDDLSEKTYQFVHIPDDHDTEYALLQVITEGEVTLYAAIQTSLSRNPYYNSSNYYVPTFNTGQLGSQMV